MENIDRFVNAVEAFQKENLSDQSGRFHSWEHCFNCFQESRNKGDSDYDYLSLQLAFYLASWGMYRGSSFLLQKDYTVHIPVVKTILDKRYDCLSGLKCSDLRKDEVLNRLVELVDSLKCKYGIVRNNTKGFEKSKTDISATLISKVLLGTLACVPAYDRFFIHGVKTLGIADGTFSCSEWLRLVDFYEENNVRLEKCRSKLNADTVCYPQMKLLDMGFWQIGYDKEH